MKYLELVPLESADNQAHWKPAEPGAFAVIVHPDLYLKLPRGVSTR